MKSYPILLLLLLSLFVDDALAEKKGSLIVDDASSLATKKGNADHHANKSTPVNFSTQQSPRVYKSAEQFRAAVSWSVRELDDVHARGDANDTREKTENRANSYDVKQGGLLQEVQTSLFNRPVQSTR
jgi:hypothetical protein